MTNTNNPEWTPPPVAESAASIDASLKDILTTINATAEALESIDDEMLLFRESAYPERAPRETGSLPPGTATQGFLNGRWNRRNGDGYGSVGLRAVSGPKFPDQRRRRFPSPSLSPKRS